MKIRDIFSQKADLEAQLKTEREKVTALEKEKEQNLILIAHLEGKEQKLHEEIKLLKSECSLKDTQLKQFEILTNRMEKFSIYWSKEVRRLKALVGETPNDLRKLCGHIEIIRRRDSRIKQLRAAMRKELERLRKRVQFLEVQTMLPRAEGVCDFCSAPAVEVFCSDYNCCETHRRLANWQGIKGGKLNVQQ